MTLPIPARIADAVAAEINSAVAAESFETLGFTAERANFDWDNEYSGLDDLVVEVVYSTIQPEGSVELEDAGHLNYQTKVDVVALKRFGSGDRDVSTGRLKKSAVDPIGYLLQQIGEHFVSERLNKPLDDEPEANFIGHQPHWVNQKEMRQGVFLGAIRLTFDFRKPI